MHRHVITIGAVLAAVGVIMALGRSVAGVGMVRAGEIGSMINTGSVG